MSNKSKSRVSELFRVLLRFDDLLVRYPGELAKPQPTKDFRDFNSSMLEEKDRV